MHMHAGIDIGANEGTPIHSVADGLVVYAGIGISGYGNVMLVLMADGWVALYAHCSALLVPPERVCWPDKRLPLWAKQG